MLKLMKFNPPSIIINKKTNKKKRKIKKRVNKRLMCKNNFSKIIMISTLMKTVNKLTMKTLKIKSYSQKWIKLKQSQSSNQKGESVSSNSFQKKKE